MKTWLTAIVSLFLAGTAFADRLAVPAAAERTEVDALIQEVYHDDYAAAQEHAQKVTLANRMVSDAMDTDDPTARYALLIAAKDLAIAGDDPELVLAIVEQIGDGYEIDDISTKSEAIQAVLSNTRADDFGAAYDAAMQVVDQAIAASRYDVATELANVVKARAQHVRDWVQARSAASRLEEIAALKSIYDEMQQALQTLEDDPLDGDANLIVGRYRCFVEGDWDAGLPCLALGSNAELAAVADLEIRVDKVAKDIGDGWWDYSESRSEEPDTDASKERAAYWYSLALPNLTGLDAALVQRRLDSLAPQVPHDEDQPNDRPLVVVNFDDPEFDYSTQGIVFGGGFEQKSGISPGTTIPSPPNFLMVMQDAFVEFYDANNRPAATNHFQVDMLGIVSDREHYLAGMTIRVLNARGDVLDTKRIDPVGPNAAREVTTIEFDVAGIHRVEIIRIENSHPRGDLGLDNFTFAQVR